MREHIGDLGGRHQGGTVFSSLRDAASLSVLLLALALFFLPTIDRGPVDEKETKTRSARSGAPAPTTDGDVTCSLWWALPNRGPLTITRHMSQREALSST